MKAAELRKKDAKELVASITELKKKLSDMRFKFSSNQVKNTKEMSNVRKEIAQTLTVLREISLKDAK